MNTDRRSVVKGLGTISLAAFAGCASSVGGGLEVESVNSQPTMAGNVILTVQVTNGSSSSESGTLLGEVDMQGGDTYTKRRKITVSGDGSNSYELKFDIDFGDSISAPQYEYTAEIE